MRRVLTASIVAVAISLSGCARVDRGRCMASHYVPQITIPQPHHVGQITILIPTIIPGHTVCDRWEFPRGRRSKAA